MKTNFVKFIVDVVSHNPGMKLEFIAFDHLIDRIVRRAKPKANKKPDKKGKGKAKNYDLKHFAEMVLGPGSVWPGGSGGPGGSASSASQPHFEWQDSTDDEAEPAIITKHGLKLETVEGFNFTDVVGVRIFEKDVISGRL